MSSARSITCASKHCRRPGAPERSQSKTGRSSSYTPNLRTTRGDPSAWTPLGNAGVGERPRVLRAGVEGGAGEVQPGRAAVRAEGLRLEPGQQPQRLGVPLEPAAVDRRLGEHPLAVVPERRMAEVVGEGRRLHQVGLAAQSPGEVAGDLGDLEAVGEPVADEVVGLGADHLGLGRQPSAGRRVHHPRTVALERRALGRRHALRRLLDPALLRGGVVRRPRHRAETSGPGSRAGVRRPSLRLFAPAPPDRTVLAQYTETWTWS